MHKNIVWLCFLSLVTGAVGWVTLKTFYLIYLYVSLDAQAPAENMKWVVERLQEDKYVMKADYTFKAKHKEYQGETLFLNDTFRNPWAGEDAMKVYSSKDWAAYYSSFNPQNSSLQRNFPLKESISSGVLWILLLYFAGVGYYVANRKD
jgi:hypothetical protein